MPSDWHEATRETIEAIVADVVKTLGLRILVWGPAIGGPNATKRLQIVDELRQLFPGAEVIPSEEHKDLCDEYTEFLTEAAQAENADLVIILDEGSGAVEEIAKFARSYCSKVHILVREDYMASEGLVASEIRYLPHEKYTDADYVECALAKKMSPKRVYHWVHENWSRSKLSGLPR